jgi:hypothetical protein
MGFDWSATVSVANRKEARDMIYRINKISRRDNFFL